MFEGIYPKRIYFALLFIACSSGMFHACKTVINSQPSVAAVVKAKTPKVLVFSKTKGFYHESIPAGIAAIQKLGAENGFLIDTTKNAAYFSDDSLKNYNVVVFLSTTGNVLDADQQVAFEKYIQAGGAFVGVHAAADTEYKWPWYNKLVGAYFASHPHQQKANVLVKDKNHVSTIFLPDTWSRFDEWYNYKDINPDIKVLATLDESSYEGGKNDGNHPIAWYHDYDGGRAFYTGGGHTDESYLEPLFLKHLLGGIQYAIGDNQALDYAKAYAKKMPEENRFTKTILSNDLNEPMELAVAPDGRVFFVERTGKFYVFDPVSKKTTMVYDFPVKGVEKFLNGLLGMTIDPDFSRNNFLYFFHTISDNDQLKQNISRFVIGKNNQLDLQSEKVLIQIPIDKEVSAHTGGSMAWDKNGNLFISTGDNTVPFESDGFAPIDQRPNRLTFDAERSAGNTNDLRGKILRIHPLEDGNYTIPEGNLFPKGTALTRPEIYVMGCRNPYRISVDPVTSILYWGEVGPDSGTDGAQGPRGYDEFNQAKKAGNYGWPYFVGDSKPFKAYDFATKGVGDYFKVNAPENNSPYNTGARVLPPAQKALVWYPYAASPEFPALGTGGRCAMGGPVYNFDPNLKSDVKFPEYYDKALFVYDWMRNWVFAVRLDENQHYKRMEPFMPITGDFRRPIDLEVGPDGAFYMLEYGSVYGIDNVDARLVRIDYNGGNRAPFAKISSPDTIGLTPFKVVFNSDNSFDTDEDDKLTYEWKFEDNQIGSTERNATYTYEKNGIYKAVLKITDQSGSSSTDTLEIKVGNTKPVVKITTPDNSSFFFPGSNALKYAVSVQDKEDKVIDPKKMRITLRYIDKIASGQSLIGHQQVGETYESGKVLMAASDCKACHQLNAKSVGPSFLQVANRYKDDKNAVPKLANKIIVGGGGVWGEHAMSAHPQLSKEEAAEIVNYVLSLAKPAEVNLPQQGTQLLKAHIGKPEVGRYIMTASYTDKGGAITPLTGTDRLVLRPAKVQAVNADILSNMERQGKRLGTIHNKSFFVLKQIDLKGIKSLGYKYASKDNDATIEVHLNSVTGPVISTLNYQATGEWNTFNEESALVKAPEGKNDLYFVFIKNELPDQHLCSLEWISFNK
ncbi:MAG: ThuA domain-containing protein [Sphingobacteriaceae bacterium]